MKFRLLLIIILVFNYFYGSAQCNCDHTITGLSSSSINIINASSYSYSPGDTFCIQAGNIAGLRLIGFNGSSSDPLVFINCGGQVVISENTYSGVAFRDCNFVKWTGTGDNGTQYGFHITKAGSGQMGVAVGYLSSDFELDHIEIENTGFAGIMAKTDPDCNDSATWRSNGYILNNLIIHDNFIHDTEGEGMYIGYTGGYKVSSNKVCNGNYVFGHWLENVDIYNNIVVNAGWDGIQVNLVRSNGKIHDNRIVNHGQEGVTYQDFAMSIGGGEYEIYNNYILVDPGNFGKGMQMISGQSGCKLYNNVFINPYSYGMFIHNRHEFEDTTSGYVFLNNTIINPELSGIMYNTGITQSLDTSKIGEQQNNVSSYFINNFVANPGSDHASGNTWKGEQESFFDFNVKSTRDAQLNNIHHNMMSRQIDTLDLIDPLLNNFSPTGASELVDAGTDVSSYGVTFDILNFSRPQNSSFDIGAYEFNSQTSVKYNSLSFEVFPNPFSDVIFVSGLAERQSFSIFDMNGRLMQSGYLGGNGQTSITLDQFQKGSYLLRIGNETIRLIRL